MEKKYGKAVATQLANPSNYISRSQADQMGLGTATRLNRAPDGGAIADYPKGWRFLPQMTDENREKMKNIPQVKDALKKLHNMRIDTNAPYGFTQRIWARMSDIQKDPYIRQGEKQHKIIDDHHFSLVLEPILKAEKEQKEREEEEQRQTIATLKMRVQELTQKPIDKPTAPAVTSSFPIIPIIIIAVIVGIFLLRRRA